MSWRNKFTINLTSILALGFLSCAPAKPSKLNWAVKPDTAFIVPGDNDAQCYDDEIAEPRFQFGTASFKWTGEGQFYPIAVRFKFKAGGGLTSDYECTIEDNLALTLFAMPQKYAEPNQPISLSSDCAFECGSLPIDESKADTPFMLVGEVKLIGYAIKDGQQIPASNRQTVFLRNLE